MSGPSYIYEMHGRCSLASETERNAHPELSRRLASLSSIRERAAQRQVQTPRSYSELRADCKYAKEHAVTEPEHLLFRSGAELNQYAYAKMLSEDARPDGCCLDSVQSRAPTYATASALAKEPGATERMAHGHLAHQSDARLFAYADPLAQYDSVSLGCSYWPSDQEKECYDRCIEHGLGSCM